MSKMTIAQLREKEVERLARFKDSEPTEQNITDARKIMNSFYRLCGLCTTNLYLANDARTCNRQSTKDSEEREERWVKRLNEQLKPYGLQLFYCGYCPSIGIVEKPHGGCVEKITRWFYN